MTNLPETETLDLELHQGWLTIWFNIPEKKNALTDKLRDEVLSVLAHVRDDRSVRGITLRGRNGVFCSGGDLKTFQSHFANDAPKEDIMKMSREAAAIMDAVNTAPQVVICLIEGAAMAGGFGVACCADVVICEASAKFAMTETMLGISPAQISPFVIQKLGYATGRRLMLTAARFNGLEAKELGFADFIGETKDELEAIEARIKKQVLRCAPGAIAKTKELILQTPGMPRDEVIETAAENFTSRMRSDEVKEGLASFFEKRKPSWAETNGDN